MEEEIVTPAYMNLANIKFCLSLPEFKNNEELKAKLVEGIREGNMAPYYKVICQDFGWPVDNGLLKHMTETNEKRIQELDQEHDKNFIDEEDQVSGIWQAKLDYLCSIGDQHAATVLAETKFNDKTVPKSHRIDAIFTLFRIAYFHGKFDFFILYIICEASFK